MSDQPVEVPVSARSRRWRPLILASLLSLLVGILVGGLVESFTSRPGSVLDRLSGFEEVPNPGLSQPARDSISYLLGTVDDIQLVATVERNGEMVCLSAIEVVEGATTGSSWSSCGTRDAFESNGMWLAGSGPNRPTTTFYWPPHGPPGIIVCRPGDWPERC